MPTRNISLTPEQDAFIEEAVKSGEYQNAGRHNQPAARRPTTAEVSQISAYGGLPGTSVYRKGYRAR
jgi:hypothetical protein